MFLFEVLLGASPVLLGRSDGTTPLQPIEVREVGDLRFIGVHCRGGFSRLRPLAWSLQVFRMFGHDSEFPFIRNRGAGARNTGTREKSEDQRTLPILCFSNVALTVILRLSATRFLK